MAVGLAVFGCSSSNGGSTARPGGEGGPAGAPAAAPADAAAVAPGADRPDPYPASQRFCDGRVYPQGGGGHISWESFATADPPATVIAHYEKVYGTGNREMIGDEAVWRWPADRPHRVLSVAPSSAPGPWRSQGCALPGSAATVITISEMP